MRFCNHMFAVFKGAVGYKFILMDNNVRPYTALLVNKIVESDDTH